MQPLRPTGYGLHGAATRDGNAAWAGLRWDDVDFDRRTIEVRRNRVSVAWQVIEGSTKSNRGRRVTVDGTLASALRSHRVNILKQKIAAGPAWEGAGQELVLSDELGRPIHPETLTIAFRSAAERSGVPRVRLHDLRHTHATLLLADGVPAKVVQERLGHSSISITLDLYGM